MSLYSMMNGVSTATFFILPMLGKRPEEYPRFRDCFLKDPDRPELDNHIQIYTRTGGVNRNEYAERNQEMRQMPGFVADYDDKFDHTYASWVFRVPEKWQADYDKIMAGDMGHVSAEYQTELRRIYPELSDMWDEMSSTNPNKEVTKK